MKNKKTSPQRMFYLFKQRGKTGSFYCGNIYNKLPTDVILYHGTLVDFAFCEQEEICRAFHTEQQAKEFSKVEQSSMVDSDNYARAAEDSENYYGSEGVDDMRFEN